MALRRRSVDNKKKHASRRRLRLLSRLLQSVHSRRSSSGRPPLRHAPPVAAQNSAHDMYQTCTLAKPSWSLAPCLYLVACCKHQY